MRNDVNESLKNIEEGSTNYYGVDSDTERRAGTPTTISYMPWKNSKELVSTINKFINSDVKKQLSDSRVTISPGSSQYISYVSKKFDKENVIRVLKPVLERFAKVYGVRVRIYKFSDTSFMLNIIKSYAEFTDDNGKILPNATDIIAESVESFSNFVSEAFVINNHTLIADTDLYVGKQLQVKRMHEGFVNAKFLRVDESSATNDVDKFVFQLESGEEIWLQKCELEKFTK